MSSHRALRSDARKNYERLLEVGRTVIAEQGADASLRDVARRAGVGLGTLYRHFPTREALLEVLLQTSFDKLGERARALEAREPDDALASWVRDFVARASEYKRLPGALMEAMKDEGSALYASCRAMSAAAAKLLERAQSEGTARRDLDGADLFALVMALAWASCEARNEARAKRLTNVVMSALFEPGRPEPRTRR